jgi:hypothetical protein
LEQLEKETAISKDKKLSTKGFHEAGMALLFEDRIALRAIRLKAA